MADAMTRGATTHKFHIVKVANTIEKWTRALEKFDEKYSDLANEMLGMSDKVKETNQHLNTIATLMAEFVEITKAGNKRPQPATFATDLMGFSFLQARGARPRLSARPAQRRWRAQGRRRSRDCRRQMFDWRSDMPHVAFAWQQARCCFLCSTSCTLRAYHMLKCVNDCCLLPD